MMIRINDCKRDPIHESFFGIPSYVEEGEVYLSADPVDREAALKEFRELVRKDPRWPEGQASLGATLMKQGRIDEALKCAREVLRLKPKHKWAQAEMSKHLLKRNEYREAIAVLRAKPSPSPFYTVVS